MRKWKEVEDNDSNKMLSLSKRVSALVVPRFFRPFSMYEGRAIADEELIKKSDDWVNCTRKKLYLLLGR